MLKPLTLALTLLSAPLMAQETEDPCMVLGELAEQIMTARQNGAPLSDLMVIAGDDDLVTVLVLEAYSSQRYFSDRVRTEVIEDFRNVVELVCYQQMN